MFSLCAGASQGQEVPVAPAEIPLEKAGRVVLAPVKGEVGDGMVVVLKRALAAAEGADALVLLIDTPGGKLDSAIEITDLLTKAPCKTIAYIHGMGAISAGALITYACDEILMVKGSNIGASTPVTMAGELPPDVNEKTKSFLRSKYRSLGELKGHDPYLGEAMVDTLVELRGYTDAAGQYRIVRVRAEEEGRAAGAPRQETVNKIYELAEQIFGVGPKPPTLHEGTPPPAEEEAAAVPAEVPAGQMELIDSATELLTLTTLEAEKVGLTTATVLGIDDGLALFDLQNAEREYIEPTRAEQFYTWLTNPVIAGLLLMIGLAGLYAEIKLPGFGLPGVIGLVCLSLFFGAHLVLGLAEWLDVALVLAGIALIAAEIFLLPGTTAAGAGGFLCILMGIYLALTRVTVPQYSWDFSRLDSALTTFSVSGLSMIGFIFLTWKIFPRTPLPRLLVQGATQDPAAGYTVQPASDAAEYLGARGSAVSMLRPAGRARIGGKVVDVVTRGEFIDEGRPVRVIRVDGNRHVVCEDSAGAAEGNAG